MGDLQNLFQLGPNVGILKSLKNDTWFYGHKRFLLRENKGLEAFKVYWTAEDQLPLGGYDPHDENDLEAKFILPCGREHPEYKPAESGDKFVYYDPVLANNNLEENHFYIVRGWFE